MCVKSASAGPHKAYAYFGTRPRPPPSNIQEKTQLATTTNATYAPTATMLRESVKTSFQVQLQESLMHV
jgi:hypothetical protein